MESRGHWPTAEGSLTAHQSAHEAEGRVRMQKLPPWYIRVLIECDVLQTRDVLRLGLSPSTPAVLRLRASTAPGE